MFLDFGLKKFSYSKYIKKTLTNKIVFPGYFTIFKLIFRIWVVILFDNL